MKHKLIGKLIFVTPLLALLFAVCPCSAKAEHSCCPSNEQQNSKKNCTSCLVILPEVTKAKVDNNSTWNADGKVFKPESSFSVSQPEFSWKLVSYDSLSAQPDLKIYHRKTSRGPPSA